MVWKGKRQPAAGAITHEEFRAKAKAGDLAPVLVFYGKEDTLIARAEAHVKKSLLGDRVTDFNFELIYCEKGMGRQIAETAATPAFGGGLKLVVARMAQELKDDDWAALARCAARPMKGSCLLLTCPGSTPWGTGRLTEGRAAFRDAMKGRGALVEFNLLDERALADYIRREAKAGGVTITEDAIALLVEETGDSLSVLFTVLEQAMLYYVGKKQLDIGAMKTVLTNLRGYTVFEFAAALGQREIGRATGMAEQMFREPKDFPLAIFNLARHFRVLVKVRDMLGRGMTTGQMVGALHIQEQFLRAEYIPQARNFPAARLSQALSIIAAFDTDVRTSRLDPARALERMMVHLCA